MIEKIILKKSAVLDKMPAAEQLDFGELAINYNAEHPFLSFKDSDGNITALNDYADAIKKKLNISDFNTFKEYITNGIEAFGMNMVEALKTKADKTELNAYAKLSDTEQTILANKLKADDLILKGFSLNGLIDVINNNINRNTSYIGNLDLQKVGKSDITQSTGTSETVVMSQKAVSDALSNVYTKAESDARYLRGDVLYEDYYYPNMSPTTDTTRFTDSTEILQPTKFIGEYTDESGQKYNSVFECDSFPDWFDFAESHCYPYDNGISKATPFFKNYTIDNGELIYNFDSMQNINISKKLPHFTEHVGLKKIDDNHFNLYTSKSGAYEFTSIDKENVDCSLFAFSPVTYNTIYDVDDCKRFRVSLIGNFQQPSRYSTIISSGSDISIKGYIQRQQLYGNEYVDFEIDKLNKRYRQIGAGYSMWCRTSHTQNWNQATQESFYSQCTLGWSNILNGLNLEVCNVGGKLIYSFNGYSNPVSLLIMGCKIKIEKLA